MDSFLVEDTETFNEVLEGTFLLGFGDGLDVAQEFVEVAGLGVHFFLLWVTQNTGDILVGWLETETTDEVTNLIIFLPYYPIIVIRCFCCHAMCRLLLTWL